MATKTNWFRLDPAQMLVEAMDCSPKEWYQRTKRIAKALVNGERGIDPWADRMMDDAESYVAQRQNAGLASARARSARSTKGQRDANEKPTEPQRPLERNANEGGKSVSRASTEPTEHKPIVPTDTIRVAATTTRATAEREASVGPSGKSPGGNCRPAKTARFDWAAFDADPYAYLAAVPHQQLPEFAAWYCHEPDNAEARRRYGAFCKAKGWLRFRGVLEGFVGECKSGEEPDNRGAALTKRIMEAWT